MKLRKTHKYLIAMFLTAVMFMASLIPLMGLGETKKVQADDAPTQSLYYFTDTIDTSIPEETIASKYGNYSIKLFSSETLRNLIATRNIDNLINSTNYITSFESGDFVATSEYCTIVFEFWVRLPNLSMLEMLIDELKVENYKVVLISAFDLSDQTQFLQKLDQYDYHYEYIDIIGNFVDEFTQCCPLDAPIIIDKRFIELDNITSSISFDMAYDNSRLLQRLMEKWEAVYNVHDVEDLSDLGMRLFVHITGDTVVDLIMGGPMSGYSLTDSDFYTSFDPIYAVGYGPLETDLYNCLAWAAGDENDKRVVPLHLLQIGPIIFDPNGLPADIYTESITNAEAYEERLLELEDLI